MAPTRAAELGSRRLKPVAAGHSGQSSVGRSGTVRPPRSRTCLSARQRKNAYSSTVDHVRRSTPEARRIKQIEGPWILLDRRDHALRRRERADVYIPRARKHRRMVCLLLGSGSRSSRIVLPMSLRARHGGQSAKFRRVTATVIMRVCCDRCRVAIRSPSRRRASPDGRRIDADYFP